MKAELLARLGALLAGGVEAEPQQWQDALTLAYQRRLAWLHEIRDEAERVAGRRRRLAVGRGPLPFPEAAEATARLDSELASQHHQLMELDAAVRSQTDRFRAERDALLALPDQVAAADLARAALRRWRAESEALLRAAQAGALVPVEPSGPVAENAEPGRFEQPPGAPR